MKNVLTTIRSQSPVLYYISMFILFLAGMSVIGLAVDDRTLVGVNVWVKPLKFTISTAIYIMTVGFLTTLYPFGQRKARNIRGIVAWTLLIEMIIIPLQAFRGVESHYNESSALDGIMFGSMGLLIGVNVLIMMIFLIETMRLKMKVSKSVQWAIFMGWAIVLVGSYVGGQMISQMGHNVGVADGGAGIPILNWSTKGGDLRIAHFFGLHGIQIIPLFALWLGKVWKASNTKQVLAVSFFGLAYAGWIAFTFFQAKQGMALIALN